jgi:cytochrome P450
MSADQMEEIFVTKNVNFSKQDKKEAAKPMVYNNIVTMETEDPMYKKKRKAISSAFFKNKVQQMIMIVKETALRVFKEIQDEGERTEQDIVKVTTRLQNHVITSVLVGSGKSFEKLPFHDPEKGEI